MTDLHIDWVLNSFTASFRFYLLQTWRAASAGWFIGLHVLGPIMFLLTSWTVAEIVSKVVGYGYFVGKAGINNYLSFVTVGFAFQSILMSTAWAGSNAIRFEQQFGTAESIFLTPSNKTAWLLGKMAAQQVFGLASAGIVFALGGLLFGVNSATTPNIPLALIGVLLTMVGMAAFGFTIAGMTFLIKKTEDLNQVLWPTMVFFCGLAFPVEVLPDWARLVSWVFPLTHGITIVRRSLLLGEDILNQVTLSEIATLLGQIAFLIPFGLLVFRVMFNHSRRTGALSTY